MQQRDFKIGDIVVLDSTNSSNQHLAEYFSMKFKIVGNDGELLETITGHRWYHWRFIPAKSTILKEILEKTATGQS